jgi:hypothetical protein
MRFTAIVHANPRGRFVHDRQVRDAAIMQVDPGRGFVSHFHVELAAVVHADPRFHPVARGKIDYARVAPLDPGRTELANARPAHFPGDDDSRLADPDRDLRCAATAGLDPRRAGRTDIDLGVLESRVSAINEAWWRTAMLGAL